MKVVLETSWKALEYVGFEKFWLEMEVHLFELFGVLLWIPVTLLCFPLIIYFKLKFTVL